MPSPSKATLALFKRCEHTHTDWVFPPGPAIYGPGGAAQPTERVCGRFRGDALANDCQHPECPLSGTTGSKTKKKERRIWDGLSGSGNDGDDDIDPDFLVDPDTTAKIAAEFNKPAKKRTKK